MTLPYEETIEFYKNLNISIDGIPKDKIPRRANVNMHNAELVAFYSERYVDVDVTEFLTKERRERLYGVCSLIHSGEFYLDVGCTNGAHMEVLYQRGINGIGLDLSIPNILRGREKYPHLKFIHGFAEAIPFKESYFDIVLLGNVLAHLRNPKITLAECLRVAKKGLALCVPISEEITEEHINPFSYERILDLLKFYKLNVHLFDYGGKEISKTQGILELQIFPWVFIRAEKTNQTNAVVQEVVFSEGRKEERQWIWEILSRDQWSKDTQHGRDETEVARFKLLSHLVEGQKVLKIGCGNGDLSVEIAKHGFDVVGVDISNAGILQAVERAKKENLDSKAQFKVMDANSLEFADNSFETVLIAEVLEHLRDSMRLIEEAIRVTRNGGRIVISVPNGLLIPFQGHLRVFLKDTLTTELSQHTSEIRWHELPFKKWLVCSFFVRKKELNITEGPSVDILMPTYNGRKYIRNAIKSVLDQTYQNWNLVIVNDGGEDVKDILDEFHDDRIKCIVTEHKGKAHALNVGITESNGEFIGYLDDDDILYPNHLEVLIKAASEGEKNFVYSDWYEVSLDENDREIGREFEYRQDVAPWMLIRQNYINHKCILHTRSLLEKAGMYDEELDVFIDWDMIRRLGFISKPYHVLGVTSERLRYYNKNVMENRITSLWTRSPDKARRSMERIANKTINLPAAIKELKKAVIDAMLHGSYYHSLELKTALEAKDIQISNLEAALRDRDAKISHLEAVVREMEAAIDNRRTGLIEKEGVIFNLNETVSQRDSKIGNLERAIKDKEIHIRNLEATIREKESTLNYIYNGHGWKALLVYYKVRDRLLPLGTKRNKFAILVFKLILKGPQITNKSNIVKGILYLKKYGFRAFLIKLRHKVTEEYHPVCDAVIIKTDMVPYQSHEPYKLNKILKGSFKFPIDKLNKIEILTANHRTKPSGIKLSLKDKQTGNLVREVALNGDQIRDNDYSVFVFDPILDSANKTYEFIIQGLGELYPSVWYNPGFSFPEINLEPLGSINCRIYSAYEIEDKYQLWIEKNEPKEKDLEKQRSKKFVYEPKISIIVPVFNTPKLFLIDMIESVLNQTYSNWELCMADGASKEPHVKQVIEYYAKGGSRIRRKFLDENKGIAGNSNEALSLATGDFIGLLDHDDILPPFALYEVVKTLNENPKADFIYSDEDKISEEGDNRFYPHFKPDWSPDTLRSCNYITHFAVIRKKILDEVGGFREGYEGSQDYDLILRVIERTQRIDHIPMVLYHWRSHPSSAAHAENTKVYAYDSAKKALNDHINRMGLHGEVYDGPFLGSYRIKYHIDVSPMVSIIIPTKDKVDVLKRCITSILQKSSYRYYRIFIVNNQSVEAETFKYYKQLKNESKIKILSYDKPFNFSAINNYAVSQIDSEYIIFLNNDTEVISSDWIEAMLEFAQRKDVGAVGALLYYFDDTIQHAGVILGLGGVACHSHKYFLRNDLGYMGRAKIIQNLSAVTAACLMTKKEVFYKVNGFRENFSHAFNDVDFCLNIRRSGYLIIYTPYVELYHHESLSRGVEDTEEQKIRFKNEIEYFQQKWKEVLFKGDPYYNPNLTLDKEDFSIRL